MMRLPIVFVGALLAVCSVSAEKLPLYTIPIESAEPFVFASTLREDDVNYLIVVDNTRLILHGPPGTPLETISLPPGASAIDLYDWDGDGEREIISVAEDRVLTHPIDTVEGAAGWEQLFTFRPMQGMMSPEPFPFVLVVPHEGELAISLPTPDGIALLSARGEPRALLPYEDGISRRGDLVQNRVPTAGVAIDIEQRIEANSLNDAAYRSGNSENAQFTRFDIITLADAMTDSVDLHGSAEPLSFPLTGARDGLQVNVIPQTAQIRQSVVRIAQADTTVSLRRYPGFPVASLTSQPDFNGDGYADLLFWTPQQNRVSPVDLLSRGARAYKGLRFTIHLFNPALEIYDGAPDAYVSVDLAERVEGAKSVPILTADVNNDGKSELGIATAADEFRIWEFKPTPSLESAYEIEIPAPVSHTYRFIAGDNGTHSLILFRGPGSIYYARIEGR